MKIFSEYAPNGCVLLQEKDTNKMDDGNYAFYFDYYTEYGTTHNITGLHVTDNVHIYLTPKASK